MPTSCQHHVLINSINPVLQQCRIAVFKLRRHLKYYFLASMEAQNKQDKQVEQQIQMQEATIQQIQNEFYEGPMQSSQSQLTNLSLMNSQNQLSIIQQVEVNQHYITNYNLDQTRDSMDNTSHSNAEDQAQKGVLPRLSTLEHQMGQVLAIMESFKEMMSKFDARLQKLEKTVYETHNPQVFRTQKLFLLRKSKINLKIEQKKSENLRHQQINKAPIIKQSTGQEKKERKDIFNIKWQDSEEGSQINKQCQESQFKTKETSQMVEKEQTKEIYIHEEFKQSSFQFAQSIFTANFQFMDNIWKVLKYAIVTEQVKLTLLEKCLNLFPIIGHKILSSRQAAILLYYLYEKIYSFEIEFNGQLYEKIKCDQQILQKNKQMMKIFQASIDEEIGYSSIKFDVQKFLKYIWVQQGRKIQLKDIQKIQTFNMSEYLISAVYCYQYERQAYLTMKSTLLHIIGYMVCEDLKNSEACKRILEGGEMDKQKCIKVSSTIRRITEDRKK